MCIRDRLNTMLSGVLASITTFDVEACGAAHVCSNTILFADFEMIFFLHWPSSSDLITRSWSRSFFVTQLFVTCVMGLPARACMAFSILARCSGGIFANDSAKNGIPSVNVVVVISHAPAFALKESASEYKGIATAKATAYRRRFLTNILAP